MERQYTDPRKMKLIVGPAIVGFAVATLFYSLDSAGAERCELFKGAAWIMFDLLPVVILAGWHCAQDYLSENLRVLRHMPQVLAYIWPLLCGVAG
jgi:hypothetical protein